MFQSPQWGSNSKVVSRTTNFYLYRFSPRNGEVILKAMSELSCTY